MVLRQLITSVALVLMTFVGPCPDEHECCHNNGDYRDNSVENLRWGTHKENGQDARWHGNASRRRQNQDTKLTAADIREIRRRYALRDRYRSKQRRLAWEFKVSDATIRRIVNDVTWQPALPKFVDVGTQWWW